MSPCARCVPRSEFVETAVCDRLPARRRATHRWWSAPAQPDGVPHCRAPDTGTRPEPRCVNKSVLLSVKQQSRVRTRTPAAWRGTRLSAIRRDRIGDGGVPSEALKMCLRRGRSAPFSALRGDCCATGRGHGGRHDAPGSEPLQRRGVLLRGASEPVAALPFPLPRLTLRHVARIDAGLPDLSLRRQRRSGLQHAAGLRCAVLSRTSHVLGPPGLCKALVGQAAMDSTSLCGRATRQLVRRAGGAACGLGQRSVLRRPCAPHRGGADQRGQALQVRTHTCSCVATRHAPCASPPWTTERRAHF